MACQRRPSGAELADYNVVFLTHSRRWARRYTLAMADNNRLARTCRD
jgi:hypothetical protein